MSGTIPSPIGVLANVVMVAAGVAGIDCLHARAAPSVSFAQDIQPILRAHCAECHGDATQRAELNLTTAAGVRRGSESGAIIAAGNPTTSRLFEVIASGEMPPDGAGDSLASKQVELIRLWIEQGASTGAPETIRRSEITQHDVLPILLLRCAPCHGRQTQDAGLDLRTVAAILRGGKSGPAIVPGDPNASLIVQKIQAEEMPPRKKLASHSVKPVAAGELDLLTKWIDVGAPERDIPADVATTEPDPLVSDEDRSFWSFQPPRQTETPTVAGNGHNPVDAFLLARLQEVGLTPAPQAAQRVLMRRAYFDLTGLPPSPAEVESFVASTDPQAYEHLIDHLLASPRYGERWAQHWLDLAGYSDSEGVQHSDPVRPHAYRYRDYVIRSLNADKPYDRFLLEQIAGDELADYENADTITDELYENLVATGFLRMTSDGTFAGITGFVPNRLDVIDDQIRVLSSAVMGLSVRCARCHSHKFDPIPQRDYYRMVALLKPAMDEHDWLKPVTGGAGNSVGGYRYLSHVTTDECTKWDKHEAEITAEIDSLKSQMEQLGDDQQATEAIEKKIAELQEKRWPEPLVRALWDRGEPSPTYLLRRGDYLQPARLVGPGVPSVLTNGRTPFAPEAPWPGAKQTGNRLALARWLTRPDHPLTARVIVNRIWKHHFGAGIVATLDDFGRAGARPSHPELLDWLAVDFVRHGWSIKHLHRLIMNSATYRRASDVTPEQQRIDPDNRLLSHMPLRRMEAEVLRDTLLSISGQLDLTPFGPADPVTARDDGLVTSDQQTSGRRRSIYIQMRRTQSLTMLDSFDRPAMSPNCVDRTVSIVAPQALFLMNNSMVHELSLAFAKRVLSDAGNDDSQRIGWLFLTALGRPPSAVEEEAMHQALRMLTLGWRDELSEEADPSGAEQDAVHRAFGNLCHAVMNSATFIYIE